ncbi:MAG: hypothetical protein RIR79_578 [Pseudomonadota bacterium]|jgi:hypothetical protein
MTTTIWSCGGGVQSTAIAALICSGKLPKPDLSLIVDTTRERSTTWDYLERWTIPALQAVGVRLERVSAADFASTDLFEGEANRLLIPAYTLGTSDTGGKLMNQCSTRWKRYVAQRWARSVGVKDAQVWMGISTDELRRVRVSHEKWWQHAYPLVDLRVNRADCFGMVRSMGWAEPPKSSCWMCPHMRDAEWRDMRLSVPSDFQKAVALEIQMQKTMPRAFLHRSMRSISSLSFDSSTLPLDLGGCDSGMCFN